MPLNKDCLWHEDQEHLRSALITDALTCLHCGEYIAAVACANCEGLFLDYDYKPDCDQVRRPARSLQYGLLCEACWDDIDTEFKPEEEDLL